MDFQVGQRVYIIPIDEYGKVTSIRRDDAGGLLFTVLREGGFGQDHLCRECELANG